MQKMQEHISAKRGSPTEYTLHIFKTTYSYSIVSVKNLTLMFISLTSKETNQRNSPQKLGPKDFPHNSKLINVPQNETSLFRFC